MDKFTKYALIACALMSAVIIGFFYAGAALGHTGLEGTDSKVEEQAAQSGPHGEKTPHSSLYELDQNGEYIGFTIVGIVGGLAAGYLWAMVFDEVSGKGGITNG